MSQYDNAKILCYIMYTAIFSLINFIMFYFIRLFKYHIEQLKSEITNNKVES